MATASSLQGRGRKNAWDSVGASATDSNLVSAIAGSKLRIVALVLNHSGAASDVTFNSKGSGAARRSHPLWAGPTDGGFVIGENPSGWFETNKGEGLTVATGAGSATSIIVSYEIVSGR